MIAIDGDTKVCRREHTRPAAQTRCKECISLSRKAYLAANPEQRNKQNQGVREWRRANPEYDRNYRVINRDKIADQSRSRLMKKYGITKEEYDRMIINQDGKCAICKSVPDAKNTKHGVLAVDHCHETGLVRGLLCDLCNRAIGNFKDSIESILAAADYLRDANV